MEGRIKMPACSTVMLKRWHMRIVCHYVPHALVQVLPQCGMWGLSAILYHMHSSKYFLNVANGDGLPLYTICTRASTSSMSQQAEGGWLKPTDRRWRRVLDQSRGTT